MAKNSEPNRFTFIWNIEQFVETWRCLREDLKSPRYVAKTSFISEWQILLKLCGSSHDGMSICIKRCEYPGPPRISINCEFFLYATEEENYATRKIRDELMWQDREYELFDFIDLSKIGSKQKKLLPGKCLTAQCIITFPPSAVPETPPDIVILSSHISDLLRSQKFSDLKLSAGNNIFSVHKVILWSRARKLAEYLNIKDTGLSSVCEVQGIEHDVLEALINYIYSRRATALTPKLITSLRKAAEVYEMHDLKLLLYPPIRKCMNHTKVLLKSVTFRWSIPCYSFLESEGTLNSFPIHTPTLNCTLVVILVKLHQDFKLYLRKLSQSENPKPTLASIKIDAIGDDGTLHNVFTEHRLQIASEDVPLSPCGLEGVIELKPCFLCEDSLTLEFFFILSDGTVLSENESAEIAPEFIPEHLENMWRLREDVFSMKSNLDFSDVILCVDKEEFPVHRAILYARSPVFAEMLKPSTSREKLNIEDVDASTFRRLLLYIYYASVVVWHYEDVKALYAAASNYALLSLRDNCSNALQQNLNKENAVEVLVLSDSHNDIRLRNLTCNFISKHADEMLETEEWKLLIKQRSDLVSKIALQKLNDIDKELENPVE